MSDRAMRGLVADDVLSRRSLFTRAAAVGAAVTGASLPFFSVRAAADGPTGFPIGISVQGRPIIAVRVGNGAARVMVVGGIHTGDEVNTVALVTAFAEHFTAQPGDVHPAATLTFIPALNVDGVALGTHRNAHDVDLNRNWPARWQPQAYHGDEIVSGGTAPFSEPETAALSRLIQASRPHAVLSWHSAYPPSGIVEGNSAALGQARVVTGKTLARAFAESSGTDYLEQWTAYGITGQLLDTLEDLGVPGMDIELASYGEAPFTANVAGLQRVVAEVIAALR